jgi:hypothetical protein
VPCPLLVFHLELSFCIVSPVCPFLSHPFSLFHVWLSSLYASLPTRAAPGLPARTRTRATPHHARAHALVTLPSGRLPPFTPWARLTLLPRAFTSAHPQSSITSPPQVTPPRQPHQHRSPQPSRDALPTRHDSLCRPQAVAAHHEPTITARSQPAHSGQVSLSSHRRRVAGSTLDPTAALHHWRHTPLAATASPLRQ